MKLSKALKVKNRLVGEINTLQHLINRDNSSEESKYYESAISAKFQELQEKTKALIELKTKIQKATVPICGPLLEMAELKGQIDFYRNLKTTSGEVKSHYDNSPPVTFRCFMSQQDVDKKLAEINAKIGDLQDEVDEHNAITVIS